MPTPEELDNLKNSWSKDPCWDIEDTPGFAEHRAELLAFRQEQEAKWEAARVELHEKRKRWIGNNDFVTLADSIRTPEEIETTLSSLDSQVGACSSAEAYVNFEITRSQVRTNLLIAVQLKRLGDLLEEKIEEDLASETRAFSTKLYKVD